MVYQINNQLNNLKILLETREALKRWLELISYPDIQGEGKSDGDKNIDREAKMKATREKLMWIDKEIWENLKTNLK